ncbi:monooxygenase [Shimwellia pseudoproteus]|uniref:acyl-CoA dehydrogenase family protein n=1 Tax=Shimwellia pseudoproteus TaxID=570012 RepID=UPI0018EAA0F2|nr:acyl-CoA dehydrogenase family protein [Shimwellia pseudoproteus]MBJ3816114.1 monooxygenase [Shimwellia pseudoproteus]
MTQIWSAWGGPGDADYQALAAEFRPVFARIRDGALAREQQRALLFEPLNWLKALRFGALRLSREQGGYGATLEQLFALLSELSEADANVTQSLRAHFGFTESVLAAPDSEKCARWLPHIARGAWVGNAWSETGNARQGTFSTRITPQGDDFLLNGEKYYTTGSLYADWINVGVSDPEGEWVNVVVDRHHPGVEVVDDWHGFGQRLTASGTTRFVDVPVAAADITRHQQASSSEPAFYQLYHLATLTGIARAAAAEVAAAVRHRQRSYSHGNGNRAALDPQILQVVGQVQSAAYGAGAIVQQGARALSRAAASDEPGRDLANQQAELEVAQGQTVVSGLVLDAVTRLFDALGASATAQSAGLDRHWRNARTLVSHNPWVYKARIVGDYAVNGSEPGYQWRIGSA